MKGPDPVEPAILPRVGVEEHLGGTVGSEHRPNTEVGRAAGASIRGAEGRIAEALAARDASCPIIGHPPIAMGLEAWNTPSSLEGNVTPSLTIFAKAFVVAWARDRSGAVNPCVPESSRDSPRENFPAIFLFPPLVQNRPCRARSLKPSQVRWKISASFLASKYG